MARKSIVNRENKRWAMHERYRAKYEAIKAKLNSSDVPEDEKWALRLELQKLPRNASCTRLTKRCVITGRAHAVYSRFGLSRMKFREHAMNGEVPGIIRSSW